MLLELAGGFLRLIVCDLDTPRAIYGSFLGFDPIE